MLRANLLDIPVRLEELRRSPDLPRSGVLPTRLPLYRPPVRPSAGQEKPIEPGGKGILSTDGQPWRVSAVRTDEYQLRTYMTRIVQNQIHMGQ